MKTHKQKSDVIHLIPDVFFAGGALVPFTMPGGGASQSVLQVFQTEGFNGYSLMNATYALEQSTIANWKDIAVLGVLGIAAKWAGKKVGLNRVGTKKVKIA